MFNFTDHVVIVSGAAGNLGAATARAFLEAGAHLVLIDHSSERLSGEFPDLTGSADHLLLGGVDLTDEQAVAGAVSQVIERFQRIDVLANIAGGFRPSQPVHLAPLSDWDAMFNLNLRTGLLLSRAVVPCMITQQSGKIINIASSAGLAGRATRAPIAAAKSAVIRLTESMDAELKADGINVNCIIPGTINTPQNRADMPGEDPKRWVEPAALADVILFLASPAARAIHGAVVPVLGLSGS